MFNHSDDRKSVAVQLALLDGRRLEGNLMLPVAADIKRVLNSDGASVEFESDLGVRSLVTKSAIVEITVIDTAKAQVRAVETLQPKIDPYEILGLTAAATTEQAKAAFDALKARYQADRYAGMGLPNDVLAYIGAKSQSIDAAYAMIGSRVASEAS